ncbi:BID domain-containing T4SS effector [Bartonella grahamii]|uniref:Protein involved in cell division n=1 Tax=Bartonella grahamii TaxID=33045 RepID=A0A336N9Y8_BARGR|nr:BID domain-containing T4SS effector [Bartonella grahamii]SSZ39186.1 Protein involved in cell division [Bartonella grahamii]
MKKHHPHPSANPEALYAKVNKPNRGNQRTPTSEEEVLYASVSSISPSRGRHHHQKQQESETDYTEVAPPKREAEVTYASVSSAAASRGRHHHQRQQESETDYTEVAPQQRGRASSSLTSEQITVILLKNPHVRAYGEEVMHWGKIVYGNDTLFQQHLQGILTDPSKGKDLSNQLAENPESIHKLAGRSALGLKSQTRKAAEDGFKPLVDAIDGYTKAVKEAKERLLQTPQAEQRRHQEDSHQAERAHHRHHHARGQNQESPEHSPQRQRHGMAYSM